MSFGFMSCLFLKNSSTYGTHCGIVKIEKETEENNTIALKHIIDTWNMIIEYNIKGYIDQGNKVLIPESEYTRLLESVKNKKYIQNLKK